MATVKAVLNKDRIKKQGDYALVIQIIHKRVKRVIYTPYKLQESEFSVSAQKAVYTDGVRYTHKQIREMELPKPRSRIPKRSNGSIRRWASLFYCVI